MPLDQPHLFDELNEFERQPVEKAVDNGVYTPFLPGVKAEEAYWQIDDYGSLKEQALACHGCNLKDHCQQVVFGSGNVQADLLFIGEGPGQEEDRMGIPFVGRAGQLLDKILKAAELVRQEVYITNVVKCRPPGNRLPRPEEIKVCRNFLEAQIRIIKPQIIVCLGSLASQTVIDPQARIGRIRGKWLMRNGVKIMATYHPAALLRNEGYKRPAWEDFKLIRDEYGNL